jgi:thiol-disulfide isomerase/thioredoxin
MKGKLLTAGLLASLALQGQIVSIGSKAPDWESKMVLNYGSSTLRLSDFSGKHVILNFWNQGCLSCVQAFPHIDSIQKKFSGRLQVILVCAESRDSTLRFFQKHPKIQPPSVPLVTDGKELWMLFTKSKTPYQLWLDERRNVVYRTGPYNLTVKHVETFLNNQRLDLINTDAVIEAAGLDYSLPADGYHSFLVPCKPGVNIGHTSGAVVDERGMVSMSSDCVSVLDLYVKAYSEFDKHQFTVPGQIELRVDDAFSYVYPEDPDKRDEWTRTHSYSYQLQLPASKKELRYRYMQQDLERYFGLKAKVEKRKLPCLALIRKGSTKVLKTKGGSLRNTLVGRRYENDSLRVVRNFPFPEFSSLIKGFIEWNEKIPFVDKTGCYFNIDLELKSNAIDPFNLQALRRELRKYNLDIVPSKEWIEVLVLEE